MVRHEIRAKASRVSNLLVSVYVFDLGLVQVYKTFNIPIGQVKTPGSFVTESPDTIACR